jgi:lysozyme
VWTDGIGNTSGVVPGKTITERQAAGTSSPTYCGETALARCVLVSVPQYVYDALVSLAFNVGTGNACSSTMVKFINQKRWRDACYQLPLGICQRRI